MADSSTEVSTVAAGTSGSSASIKWQSEIEDIRLQLPEHKTKHELPLHALDFADDSCLQRYVEAHRGDTSKALKGILATAAWRQDTVPKPLGCSVCSQERTNHCFELVGHDKFDRPIIYGCPARASRVR